MNSPPINVSAPSPQPALELIALAQLSPDLARQRLRALLLTNPNYFVKLPPTSFSAVLNICEDTTYEGISHLGYDPETDQISAAIAVKQPNGYSSEFLFQGSEEFVRFYLSHDGGSKWRDLGMRSITVVDAHHPRPLAYEVALHNISGDELAPCSISPMLRAILSWSTPPPPGEPSWTPVWGHVAESEIHLEVSQMIGSKRSRAEGTSDRPESPSNTISANKAMEFTPFRRHVHLSKRALRSTSTDPHHSFLEYVLSRAAIYCRPCCSDSRTAKSYSARSRALP